MSNFISFITVINLFLTDISQKMILVCTNFLSVCDFCISFFNSSLLKKMLVVVFFTYHRVHTFLVVLLLVRM